MPSRRKRTVSAGNTKKTTRRAAIDGWREQDELREEGDDDPGFARFMRYALTELQAIEVNSLRRGILERTGIKVSGDEIVKLILDQALLSERAHKAIIRGFDFSELEKAARKSRAMK